MRISFTSDAKDQFAKIAKSGDYERLRNTAEMIVVLKRLEQHSEMQYFSELVDEGVIRKISSQDGMDVFNIERGKLRGWFSITNDNPSRMVLFKFELID
jgi:hypothetical protein